MTKKRTSHEIAKPRRAPKPTKPRGMAGDIPVHCAYDEIVPAADLKLWSEQPNSKNPQIHPAAQLDRYETVVAGNGYRRCAVRSTLSGCITKGNGLVQMARRRGWSVPVENQTYATRAEELRDVAADNQLAKLAQTDNAALHQLLAELDPGDIQLAAVTTAEFERLLADLDTTEGEFPSPQNSTKATTTSSSSPPMKPNSPTSKTSPARAPSGPTKKPASASDAPSPSRAPSPPSVKIVIPSMSRAATMTTHKLLPNAIVCVPQSQRDDYRRVVENDRILLHPDSVKGLTPKLNWIFDRFDESGHRDFCFADSLVFVDDDITSIQRCFTERDENPTIRDPAIIEQIIINTARLARDLGAFYFGWEASNGALRYYTGLRPFALTGYINGCAMGFRRGHGLRFDPRIVAKNDFDIAAANAHRHRLCVKDCRYTFVQKETFTGRGGQAAYRTSDTERRDVDLLRKKWGPIFRIGGHSGTRKRDYAGIQKITMHLPF